MDLLLTHGYFLSEDPKELQIMKPYAPLGILYLSSHLRRAGFDVEVYDSTFGSREELLRILDEGPPGVIWNLRHADDAAERLADRRGCKGAWVDRGSWWAGAFELRAEYLEAGADVVVEGEGEQTMEELLLALRSHDRKSLERVAGVHFRGDDGPLAYTGGRELIADLDAQPLPDRERIDIQQYVRVWREHHGKGSVSVITSRGCPYHCRWCSHSTFGKTHRRRSVANVADEVEWILDRYDPDMLWMADDVFTIHTGWTLQYAEELERRGIRIPFECITRADRVNPKIADALARMGCFRVWIGSESGSQRVLDAMERGVTIDQVHDAVELSRQRGIETGMFLMWGYKGEELSDIEATVDHVKACRPDVFLTTVSYPIKGTPYHDEVSDRLVIPNGWGKTTDRELKIQGRHSRSYYGFADELLRSEVRLQQLREESDGAAESPDIRGVKIQIAAARRGLQETAHEVEA